MTRADAPSKALPNKVGIGSKAKGITQTRTAGALGAALCFNARSCGGAASDSR